MTDYTPAEWAALSEEVRGDCIETTAWRDKNGYGSRRVIRFGKVLRRAHVVAWVEDHGQLPPPEKPQVLHHCDNPPCVNPDHLWIGTNADNMADRNAKDRVSHAPRGRYRATQCPRGHELTPENTGTQSNGCRRCKACLRDAYKRYRQRKKLGLVGT